MSAKRKACWFCGREALVETIERNEGFCERCKNLKGYTKAEIDGMLRQLDAEREEDDLTPYPRSPPPRTFDKLAATGIRLDADKYAGYSREAPRYDSYDYAEEKNSPRWSDEDRFYDWLIAAQIPRELAEMLYRHAPEVSFMLEPGHIKGVEGIIDYNSADSEIRKGGYFTLASGSNGDFVVIALCGDRPGEVGYLSHETIWGKSPAEVQAMFIPVIASIGDFFDAFEAEEECELPRDYYDAKDQFDG